MHAQSLLARLCIFIMEKYKKSAMPKKQILFNSMNFLYFMNNEYSSASDFFKEH